MKLLKFKGCRRNKFEAFQKFSVVKQQNKRTKKQKNHKVTNFLRFQMYIKNDFKNAIHKNQLRIVLVELDGYTQG